MLNKVYHWLRGNVKKHMLNLGIALIGASIVILGFGLQSYFTWENCLLAIILWVLSGLLFTLGLSLAIIHIYRNKNEITPRQRERDKRLRTHFDDMQKISSDIIPTLNESYGRIVFMSNGFSSSYITQQINDGVFHDLPPEFTAHFTKEANTWASLYPNIYKHNENCADFELRIREYFKSSGLEVVPDEQGHKSPYIYEYIFHPLFIWWKDRYNQLLSPQIDFAKIHPNVPSYGQFKLVVDGWGSYISYAETEIDKEKCVKVIRSLANDTKFEREATELIKSATALVQSINDSKSELIKTIQTIEKYWPGDTDYKFTRLKQCPICKKIT